MGIRGYSPEVLDALKCHQDAQLDKGTGLMLKYAATHLPKFSDGPGKELMDDHSSGYAAARRVLFTYHPGEPDLALCLSFSFLSLEPIHQSERFANFPERAIG